MGQGSFGITYLGSTKTKMQGPLGAIDMEVKVAIKEFFMREVNGRRENSVTASSQNGLYDYYKRKFKREAENLSHLKHTHIVHVLECFEANNTVYYVMEFVDGGSLDSYIQHQGKLSEVESIRLAHEIGESLSYMHSRKMLHLDLKPGNIMLRADKSVVLIDFGLSKQYNEKGMPESSTTVGAGTPGYAPMEQANYREQPNNSFPATMDVYALGATVFKMLTGKCPPTSSDIFNIGFLACDLQDTGVSEYTIGVLAKAMAPKVVDRYTSVVELVRDLSRGTMLRKQESSTEAEVTDLGGEILRGKKVEEIAQLEVFGSSHLAEPPKPPIPKSKEWRKRLGIVLAVVLCCGYGIYLGCTNTFPDAADLRLGQSEGHDYVDLGLSVKWATCNVGADSPVDYGDYFAWGETSPKDSYDEENSKTYGKHFDEIFR